MLTHGVGRCAPTASGALLLDLDDPHPGPGHSPSSRSSPPVPPSRDGYVPNVVYTSGRSSHGDALGHPRRDRDCSISVASVSVAELLRSMHPLA